MATTQGPTMFQASATPSDSAPNTPWTPQPDDPITHIQIGNDHFHIHTDDLAEAQRRVPNLIVPGKVNGEANAQNPARSLDLSKVTCIENGVKYNIAGQEIGRDDQGNDNDAWAAFAKKRLAARQTQQPASPQTQDAQWANFAKKRMQIKQTGVNPAAARTGAYQQRGKTTIDSDTGALVKENGPIYNVNADRQLLHDVNGNWNGTYLQKRDGETDPQFMARVIEAGKYVTPKMIEQENRANKYGAPAALGAAALAGPAMLGAESLAAAPFVSTTTGTGRIGPSLARQALTKAAQLAAKHPTVANLLKLGGLWTAAKIADELGVPLPKIVKLMLEGQAANPAE